MMKILFISLILYNGVPYEETMPLRLCIPAAQAAIAEYETEEKRIKFLRGYRYGALRATIGLSNKSSLDKEDTPYARGYRSGKKYAGEKTKTKQHLSLSEFGYEPITLEGILRLGFERSHFTPNGQDRPYWIVFADYMHMRSQIPKGTWPDGKSVIVKGWLSPRGTYGHMGLARHEIVAIEISENTRQTEQDASPKRP
jgi:hypothetical protein